MEWARWHLRPGKASCGDCIKLYRKHNEMPPCSECGKPQDELTPQGATAFGLWRLLDAHDRPYWQADGMPLALPLPAIRGVIQDYKLSMEMQELIVALEEVALPIRQKEHARSRPKR